MFVLQLQNQCVVMDKLTSFLTVIYVLFIIGFKISDYLNDSFIVRLFGLGPTKSDLIESNLIDEKTDNRLELSKGL
jgi:hypothetical protein